MGLEAWPTTPLIQDRQTQAPPKQRIPRPTELEVEALVVEVEVEVGDVVGDVVGVVVGVVVGDVVGDAAGEWMDTFRRKGHCVVLVLR